MADPPETPQPQKEEPQKWGARIKLLSASTAFLLLTNVLTITRQGIESWWSSLINNGNLKVGWSNGPMPQGVSVQAKGEDGKGVEFNPNSTVALTAGKYSLRVTQFDKELPIALLSDQGVPITHVTVRHFMTTQIIIKPAPTDPLFAGVYDRVANALGRPKNGGEKLSRVYQGFHENGTLLWLYDTNMFYVLRTSDGTWAEQPGAPYPDDPCLYNQACIDKRDQAPARFHAEIGGGNRVWKRFRNDLGWMIGYCIYHDAVLREEFEAGALIGPLGAATFGTTATALSLDTAHKTWQQPTIFGGTLAKCEKAN
jgi:hypothetical protein